MSRIEPAIFDALLQQLALDYACEPSDFLRPDCTVVPFRALPGRRQFGPEPPFWQMATLGRGAVLCVHPCVLDACQRICQGKRGIWLFEYPNLRQFDELLRPHGYTIFGSFHHYLPGACGAAPAPRPNTRWFEQEEIIKERFGDAFPNALGFDPGRPDVLAVALYQGEQIAALAGASADSARFWQIGIDALPEFERQGMGKYLVALLRQEILRRGKIPYYGTSEANLASRGIAAATGFVPAWAEAACKKEK